MPACAGPVKPTWWARTYLMRSNSRFTTESTILRTTVEYPHRSARALSGDSGCRFHRLTTAAWRYLSAYSSTEVGDHSLGSDGGNRPGRDLRDRRGGSSRDRSTDVVPLRPGIVVAVVWSQCWRRIRGRSCGPALRPETSSDNGVNLARRPARVRGCARRRSARNRLWRRAQRSVASLLPFPG